MTDHEYLPLIQAAAYLGISRPTLRRMIIEGTLVTTTSPFDARVKLIKRADLDRLKAAPRPSPVSVSQTE